jgi:hypothetical protein
MLVGENSSSCRLADGLNGYPLLLVVGVRCTPRSRESACAESAASCTIPENHGQSTITDPALMAPRESFDERRVRHVAHTDVISVVDDFLPVPYRPGSILVVMT